MAFNSPTSLIRAIFLETPDDAWWSSLVLWVIRVITFSLLLRTYLIPWVLALVSRHVRVRSVSIWSIRGLYIHKGARTYRVDRISYSWARGKGLNLRLDGLSVEVGKTEPKAPTHFHRSHNRTLTLADFAPSPMAYRIRQLFSVFYSLLEPFFRPIIRTCVVACLRLMIRWLPRAIGNITFDLQSTSVTFSELPGARMFAEKISLHVNLSFTQLEEVIGAVDQSRISTLKSRRLSGMAAWKRRLTDSFRRSLDRAWGKAQGAAVITFKLHNIVGSMTSAERIMQFLQLPGAIYFEASMKFNPREGSIDPHSLTTTLDVGDSFVKLDALNLLLNSLKKPPPSQAFPAFPEPSASLSSSSISAFPTPASPTSEHLFSPISPVMSPNSDSLPHITLPSDHALVSPISPTSPLLGALSASIRRRYHYQSCVRLKNVKQTSLLSVLKNVRISISAIVLSAQPDWGGGPYEAIIQDITLNSNLCDDPSENSFHKQWLGRGKRVDECDSDIYGFEFSIQKVAVERRTELDSMRLLTLRKLAIQALATQWPAPWLVSTPFMCGDPNASFFAVRIGIAGIEFTERVECLRELVAQVEPSTTDSSVPPTTLRESYNIPRLAFDLECGTIRGRIICGDPRGSQPTALELRTNGFIVSLSSNFRRDLSPDRQRTNSSIVGSPLQMDYRISVVLEPVLVRVRAKSIVTPARLVNFHSSDPDFLDDPPVLSMGSLEIFGEGHAAALIKNDTDNSASVVSSSAVLDLHCSTDALCVELWHPKVIEGIHQLFSLVPRLDKEYVRVPYSKPLLDRLPGGISITVAVVRFVVFVTAPDVNPLDTMDLSRGFAFKTRISLQYSSMRADHAYRFHLHHLQQRTQTRHKLYLPQEKLVDAVTAARASTITHNVSAFIKIHFSSLALRSAVATQYDADNPLIAEMDDPALGHQEFLYIANAIMSLSLSGKRNAALSKTNDSCEITGEIPYIRSTFHLAHAYSVLLAIQTMRSLRPVSIPRHTVTKTPSTILYHYKLEVATIQVMWVLSKQSLVTRVDGINLHASTDEPLQLQMNKAVVWVCMPSRVNRWDEDFGEKWEELLGLQTWNTTLLPAAGIVSIIVSGDSLRLRIPSGYILADLIVEATVIVKALRHLSRVAVAGQYTDMPAPEPEGPKAMPKLSFRIRCLCLEAADDPLESKLAIIWRAGLDAAKQRAEREEAFLAKVAVIHEAESEGLSPGIPSSEQDYQFSANHSVSIKEARRRLDEVHALDWTLRLQNHMERHSRSESLINQRLRSTTTVKSPTTIPNIVVVAPMEQVPPLFRATFNDLSLSAQPPSFPIEKLPEFLYNQGHGLPRETLFSLLVPMHLSFSLSSLHLTLRDYPLPLFSIPPHHGSSIAVLEFDTDLVIGEEMGTDSSVDWIDCPVLEPHQGVYGSSLLSILVPKTIMPVKSYANPTIHIITSATTTFSWGVSYTPATQDLMRVIESLSSSPRDASPIIGFWDKMRLIFHWSIVTSFKGEVRAHIKGSRDPYEVTGTDAGFVLSFQGNPKLLVGLKNDDSELIQVISDSMFIAIPNLHHLVAPKQRPSYAHHVPETPKPFRKICAKLRSGIRFGIGFVLERSCGIECLNCSGTAFQRKCRYFNFLPHHEIKLEKKAEAPLIKGPDDSFNLFRSDFIHLSISLASSTKSLAPGRQYRHDPSSLHLTPKAFTHFWSWCALFDGVLSLPIRQGTYYPPRPISPKLGRHLATLKYRVHIRHLFIMHAYIDESRETWVDGKIPWIGVKGMIDEFQVDMHQRDEELTIPGLAPNTTKIIRRKPFYAAEVVLVGLDLRAMLAKFDEPLRQDVQMTAPPQRSNYGVHQDLPTTDPSSPWSDPDDFVETDWSPSEAPKLHLLPVVACPHFTYFKRNSAEPGSDTETSKFGIEKSHTCLLGKEPSVPQVQISLASARISELRRAMHSKRSISDRSIHRSSLEKMIELLQNYIIQLQETDGAPSENSKSAQSYLFPSYIVSPDEWAEFENVYQIHCPKIYMDTAIRDIMMQYYYCSRSRRGLEYHMSTRAVKFIRDQAKAALGTEPENDPEKTWSNSNTAQIAASALRRMLGSDQHKSSVEVSTEPPPDVVDPLNGWSDGVSLRKGHCCLLLKPQIVMRGDTPKDVCILAAAQAKLQSFAIMDNSNADDPVSGKVMSRSYTSVSDLQAFSPVGEVSPEDGCVPFEVFIDLRCESNDFDRLVPQTDATFHYDKFNRLRLRNNVTSASRGSTEGSTPSTDQHLKDQTDLIRVHIPRFTVSANDEHFQAISHIVTKLLLFSDAAHKTRLDKLETLLFTYDFTDLESAADVVCGLRSRLTDANETQKVAENSDNQQLQEEEGQLELLKLKAHIFLLSEELNCLFDAIKLAQDRFDDHTDHKSALLLHASSSEISWRMLDDRRELLSKLVVQDIDFYWLSRQDSSTGNNLAVGNLQAFDGSRHALWAEILSKYDEPANHPLLKRGLFLLASWTILAPVGGITIYESFELSLHPMRLQIDARVGRRIMEYLWPARRNRPTVIEDMPRDNELQVSTRPPHSRTSLDSPRVLHGFGHSGTSKELAPPLLRRLGSSRSFTDLRTTKDTLHPPPLNRVYSSETLRQNASPDVGESRKNKGGIIKRAGDAAEMKTRASQKSFVLVRISSLNILLSIVKEGSFECHEARIRTRDLEYRNQTWSFEELVNQFIPSDMSWRGWVKMAFQQPLLPVLPVARELISKTKWMSSSKGIPQIAAGGPPPKLPRAKVLSVDDDLKLVHSSRSTRKRPSKSPGRVWRKGIRRKPENALPITDLPITDEPESLNAEDDQPIRPTSRKRVMSLFSRGGSSSKIDFMSSSTTLRHPDYTSGDTIGRAAGRTNL